MLAEELRLLVLQRVLVDACEDVFAIEPSLFIDPERVGHSIRLMPNRRTKAWPCHSEFRAGEIDINVPGPMTELKVTKDDRCVAGMDEMFAKWRSGRFSWK